MAFFGNIDKDLMSYYHLVELARTVGFNDGDTLFYVLLPFDAGIDHLKDDTLVLELMKYANQTNCFEVYIQRKEHDMGGHVAVGDTDQQLITTEVLLLPLCSHVLVMPHMN